MSNEDYPIERTGGVWDRIWRGRASSHRRALANAALHAARCATALGEAARLIDEVASDRRAAEVAGLALQVRELAANMSACADHLEAESGFVAAVRAPWWRWLWRDFVGWLRG